ncbi:glycoside hydrolase family 16 protein [Candidatus Frankia alpina]|uniref:glycoside hydrolase family 16 protein n=1 Tax=Candidatus Frankia alpina TaxID=2699483 RepID=UPI0013D7CB12|nr:glycoside hydrolase family 16 protein [Candidatus Frankia alpina]
MSRSARTGGRLLVAGLVAAVGSCAPTSGGPGAAPSAAAATGSDGALWGAPVKTDDFNGSAVDASKWFVYDSPTGSFPRVPSAVTVADGSLRITGGNGSAGRDVSGGLASLLHQQYGRWEARFRVDPGAGYSAVVLLWPQSQKWPDDGEIDMIEVQDGTRGSATMAVHNGAKNDTLSTPTALTADFTAWHTVAVEWLPGRLSYYLDGRNVFTVLPARTQNGAATIPTPRRCTWRSSSTPAATTASRAGTPARPPTSPCTSTGSGRTPTAADLLQAPTIAGWIGLVGLVGIARIAVR